MSPPMKVIWGGGDIVETLTNLLDQAKAGEIDAIAYATVEGEMLGGGWAHVEDLPHAFARLMASVSSLNHVLLTDGF